MVRKIIIVLLLTVCTACMHAGPHGYASIGVNAHIIYSHGQTADGGSWTLYALDSNEAKAFGEACTAMLAAAKYWASAIALVFKDAVFSFFNITL